MSDYHANATDVIRINELEDEVERLKAELDKAWRAALDQGCETTRLREAMLTHAAAIHDEAAAEVFADAETKEQSDG